MAVVSTQIDSRIDFGRLSRFTRAVRVMTWILIFVKNARCPQGRESSPDLSSAETEAGRIMVLKGIQNEFYNEDISDLKNGKCIQKTSFIYQLSPFIGEDGLIRIYGRIEKAPALLYDEKRPILLPKCHITYLLVKYQHELMKHAGVNTLITAVRGKYWLEKAPALLYDEKHPILLPKCHISYLLVKDQHELMKHAGVNTLITAVRGKYWILSLKTIAKK